MMSATLLLHLAAPLQTWGHHARSTRAQPSQPWPTKSGVIGLIANALGRDYTDDISDLAGLDFGVRLDLRGNLIQDYISMRNLATSNAKRKPSHEMWRWMLADAVFVAGLCGDRGLLDRIESALYNPARVLYLGRRACVPTPPLCLGIVNTELERALRDQAWLGMSNGHRPIPEKLLAVIEDPGGDGQLRDVPAGPFSERRFASRRVRWTEMPVVMPIQQMDTP